MTHRGNIFIKIAVTAIFLTIPALAQGTPPVIGSVVGAGLSTPYVTQITAGGIITLFGSNFTPVGVTHALQASDITGGGTTMPTNMVQTCVQIGGVPAALYYVSPTQINAQTTAVASSGSVDSTASTNRSTASTAVSSPSSSVSRV